MARFVVMLGPPGAGKGTQAKLLAKALDMPHVSSGDLFRDHLGRKTELGELAKQYMDRGDLVPDDVTVSMVIERIGRSDCQNGVILDGFPRTLAQAKALDEQLAKQGQGVSIVPLSHSRATTSAVSKVPIIVITIAIAPGIRKRRLSSSGLNQKRGSTDTRGSAAGACAAIQLASTPLA